MADVMITKEMVGTLKILAAEIKETEAYKTYSAALDTYTRSEKLNRMVFEYNVHQQAISEEYKKDEPDSGVIESINKRMNELYAEIMEDEDYKAFFAAQSEYEKLMNAVNSELDYQLSGKRACSHDCSTCGGCSDKAE